MFERPQKPPEQSLPYALPVSDVIEAETLDKKQLEKLERKYDRRRKFGLKLGAIALITSTISSAYWNDVKENRAEYESATISLNILAPPINESNTNKATVFINGFNTYDADDFTNSLGPAIQQVADGELWSLSYNNAPLSRERIYESVVSLAEDRNISSISFAGRSTGGIIGTEAASDTIENTDLPVNSLILIDTPDGTKGVASSQLGGLNTLQIISDIPGSLNSSAFRLAGEIVFHTENFTQGEFKEVWDVSHNASIVQNNIEGFVRTTKDAIIQLNNPKNTSSQLLAQQAYKINHFDMLHELEKISAQRDKKQMPVILDLSGDDLSIVNGELSSNNFADYAEKTDLVYLDYIVAGATHSEYYKSLDEYMNVFNEASIPMAANLQAEATRRALILASQNDTDDPNSIFLAKGQ